MIAVDVMGGDYAPQEAVQGALAAAQKGVPLILFGNQDKVMPLLAHYYPRWRSLPIELVHCADVIDMDEDPVRGILRKKDSSIVRALQAVQSGKAQAFVSAGNSGAVMAAATIVVGRVPGVIRPAIGSFLPTTTGSLFCLDLGANPDCKPEYLVQFAYMGYAYVRLIKHIAQPRVALLSNGHESYKGSMLVKNAFDLISKTDLEFVGNIEARDIFSGHADVVVTDGFTGNVLLKGIQGTAKAVMDWMKDEASRSLILKILLGLAYPLLRRVKNKVDYARTGGALLLGVNKPVVIAHGSSKSCAITQAIFFAQKTVDQKIMPTFNETLQVLLEKGKTTIKTVKLQPAMKQVQL
ncbi:MAG TPA: phosphate acyltransferase PlsX [Candidatus Babeliales bacterium]|jgi:glycerol-3-phosphate acyltransferase PlsX|nr:phosphate acyltransferase PlsX [Candidatus Babeliales bacterium]